MTRPNGNADAKELSAAGPYRPGLRASRRQPSRAYTYLILPPLVDPPAATLNVESGSALGDSSYAAIPPVPKGVWQKQPRPEKRQTSTWRWLGVSYDLKTTILAWHSDGVAATSTRSRHNSN